MNRLLGLFCFVLIGWSANSQSPDRLVKTNQPQGGRWMIKPGITQIISLGQPSVSNTLVSEDQIWSGTVGFLSESVPGGKNLPPIAIVSSFADWLDEDLTITLKGFDPEGDEILAEVVSGPASGKVEKLSDFEFSFSPSPSVYPDVNQLDSLIFRVKETNSSRASSNTVYRFRYAVPDSQHQITDASTNSQGTQSVLSVSWKDSRFNQNYRTVWSYYDLSNPDAPVYRQVSNQNWNLDQLSKAEDTLSVSIDIEQSSHPYIFSSDRVFFTTLVSSPNGNSDVFSFVFENGTNGRTEASEDGLFFAFGNEMDVRENSTSTVQFSSVELGDFNVSGSEIQLISKPNHGSITTPILDKTGTRIKTWRANYTGTSDIGGKDSVQFRVFHPERQIYDTAWLRINIIDVNDAPKIALIQDQVTNEEVNITIPVQVTDPDSELEYILENSESSRLSSQFSNGSILLSPVKDFFGRASVTFIAKEKEGDELVAVRQFDLTVNNVNDAPIVSPISDQTIQEDQSLILSVSASDVDAELPLFNYSVTVNDPLKLNITVDESTLNIIPNPNVFGEYEINVFADDQLGTSTSKSKAETFKMIIEPVNDKPEIVKAFKTQKIFNDMPAYTLSLGNYFTDVENGSDLSYSLTGNELADVSISGNVLIVNASANLLDYEDVTITASDGEYEVSQGITFVKSNVSVELVQNSTISNVELDEDFGIHKISLDGLFTDTSNPSAQFSYEILGNNNVDIKLSEDEDSLILESPNNFNGSDKVFLIVSSGDKSAYTSFDISILPINDAPQFGTFTDVETIEDFASDVQFIGASDIDNDFSELSISAVSANPSLIPSENITINPANGGFSFSVLPTINLFGNTTISLFLSDGSLSDTVIINVAVLPVNDDPSIKDNSIWKVNEDEVISRSISNYFTDIEGDPLSYTVLAKPDWVTINNKTISGKPLNDQVGVHQFSIQASDGNGGSVIGQFSIEVINTNDAPVLVQQSGTLLVFQESSFSYEFPTLNFRDIDKQDQLVYEFVSYPDWTSVSSLTLSGTPQYENVGSYSVVMKATDNSGVAAYDTLRLNVEFTVYDVDVSVDILGDCSQTKKTVTATGAFDYNWYDSDGQIIQSGGKSIELSGYPRSEYFVEGVNESGYKTPNLVSFSIECPLGTSEVKSQVQLYPNPAIDQVFITGINPQDDLYINDLMGRKISVNIEYIDSVKRSIDVSNLKPGVYFINVSQGSNKQIIKFIKQ